MGSEDGNSSNHRNINNQFGPAHRDASKGAPGRGQSDVDAVAEEYLRLLSVPFETWFLDHEHSPRHSPAEQRAATDGAKAVMDESGESVASIRDFPELSPDSSELSDSVFASSATHRPSRPSAARTQNCGSASHTARDPLRRLRSYGSTDRNDPVLHFDYDRVVDIENGMRFGAPGMIPRYEQGRATGRATRRRQRKSEHPRTPGEDAEVLRIRASIRDCRLDYKKQQGLALAFWKLALHQRSDSQPEPARPGRGGPASTGKRRNGKLVPVLKL